MKLDLDLEKYTESTGVQLVPAGVYPVIITGTDGKSTQSDKGKGYQLLIKMKVTSGEYQGVNLIEYITIMHDSVDAKGNRTAENIGRGSLKTICRVTDIGSKIEDSEQLHGKKMNIRLEQEVNSKGKIYNTSKGFDVYDEALAKSKAMAAQAETKAKQDDIPDAFKSTSEQKSEGVGFNKLANEPPAREEPPTQEKAPWEN